MENRRVGSSDEGPLTVHAQPDHRANPRGPIIRIATSLLSQVLPENLTSLLRKVPRKSVFDFHEPILNEAFEFLIVQ